MTDFSTLNSTPKVHFRLWQHAAITRVAVYLVSVGGAEMLDHYGFLRAYLDEVQAHLPDVTSFDVLNAQLHQAITIWETNLGAEADLWPLPRLAQSGLSPVHLLALMLTGLVESDARFGTVYALLHPLPEEQRLSVGLLTDLLSVAPLSNDINDDINDNVSAELNGWQVAQELHRRGLITIEHPDRPRAARTLRVCELLWDICLGDEFNLPGDILRYHPASDFVPLADLQTTLPPNSLRRLVRVPDLLAKDGIGGLILRGMRGSGRLQVLGSIAHSLNRDVLVLSHTEARPINEQMRLLGPLAVVRNAFPVIELDLGPGEIVTLPSPAGYAGPLGIILGQEGSLQGAAVERCVTLQLPAPRQPARHTYWGRMLGGESNGNQRVIEQASARFHLTFGGIARASRLAQAYAALDGRDHIHLYDIQEACRTMNQQSLDALATRMEVSGGWESLIVTDAVRAELQNLIMRCRQREAVLDHLGVGFGRITRGVRALFGGASGTGKTLAARILAVELGLDLYRVDLATVVSKYIGETERNLSRLFARAEEQDIILLLDEGDSLLTGRTEVRTSNDRYANMETNYLLQRLEHYQGIFLVTSNAANRIDSAFQRRMDVYIEFSPPNAAQRYAIWQLHLPQQHAIDEKFMRTIATRCTLSGGQIRNAALHATVLAVEHNQLLSSAWLAEGVAREYHKIGTTSPLK